MACLVVFSKRSYLGSCTLDYGTTVCNPNCGQRVADDYARVPESAGWSFCCLRSTSPKPEGLSNVQFALVVFRCVMQGSFPSAFVIQCQACLQGNASHSHRPFLCQFSCLLPAHYAWVCPSTLQNGSICGGFLPKTRWYALYPLSLIFDALAWFTASQSSSKSVHVCASGPSCVILHWSSFQSLPARSVLPFLHGASSGVTSSLVPSLSTFSAKEHRLRCWSTTRMRGLPYDRNQLIGSVCVPQGFSRLIPHGNETLQSSTPTHYVHGRQIALAVLTTRLTDSVDHTSAGNTLAAATLVITFAGPLRTNTLDRRRISSRSPCAS